MSKSATIEAIILGAAVGVCLLKFYNMPEDERKEFFDHLKNRAHELLDNTEETINTVKDHFAKIDAKPKEEWVQKLLVGKNLLKELFG